MKDNIEGTDFVRYCIYQAKITNEQRNYLTKPREGNWLQKLLRVQTTVKKVKPPMTDKQVLRHVNKRGELGFQALPKWLQKQLEVRDLNIKARPPTEIEMWETISDAREHRMTGYKTKTIQDYLDHYKGVKSYDTV